MLFRRACVQGLQVLHVEARTEGRAGARQDHHAAIARLRLMQRHRQLFNQQWTERIALVGAIHRNGLDAVG